MDHQPEMSSHLHGYRGGGDPVETEVRCYRTLCLPCANTPLKNPDFSCIIVDSRYSYFLTFNQIWSDNSFLRDYHHAHIRAVKTRILFCLFCFPQACMNNAYFVYGVNYKTEQCIRKGSQDFAKGSFLLVADLHCALQWSFLGACSPQKLRIWPYKLHTSFPLFTCSISSRYSRMLTIALCACGVMCSKSSFFPITSYK